MSERRVVRRAATGIHIHELTPAPCRKRVVGASRGPVWRRKRFTPPSIHDKLGEMTGGNFDSSVVPRTLVIDRTDAAEALLDRTMLAYLAPFVAEQRTAAEAARELGVATNSLLYPIRRLEMLGLLELVEVRARKGRPMNVYRAAAEVFFVPFEVSRSETLETYLLDAARAANELVTRGVARVLHDLEPGLGVRVSLGLDGRLASRLAASAVRDLEPSDEVVLLDFVHPNLRLSFEQARALQAELTALLGRYSAMGGPDRYGVRLALCLLGATDSE